LRAVIENRNKKKYCIENQKYKLLERINSGIEINYVALNRNDILDTTEKQELSINL